MNTLTGSKPILPQEKSKVLFDSKDIDFGFPEWQLQEISSLWHQGKSLMYITKIVKRNQHEVFFRLYEAWIDGKIDDIEKAFSTGEKLLKGRDRDE
ncbi:hypothetical protein SAMN05216232_0210 [Virgibacillus subterraneus]|uniref:Uncharacterized protein n=1 Tax=Virgibacillus subterraneus TaxID=621109 RepID=A0A1H8YZG2_9BACI|nr:hypothetical protein [Virgibacillus subterraneus]SEP57482.1 hypothetical protein SAMN05216232_0210 [Virgibacillus subterraneus]